MDKLKGCEEGGYPEQSGSTGPSLEGKVKGGLGKE